VSEDTLGNIKPDITLNKFELCKVNGETFDISNYQNITWLLVKDNLIIKPFKVTNNNRSAELYDSSNIIDGNVTCICAGSIFTLCSTKNDLYYIKNNDRIWNKTNYNLNNKEIFQIVANKYGFYIVFKYNSSYISNISNIEYISNEYITNNTGNTNETGENDENDKNGVNGENDKNGANDKNGENGENDEDGEDGENGENSNTINEDETGTCNTKGTDPLSLLIDKIPNLSQQQIKALLGYNNGDNLPKNKIIQKKMSGTSNIFTPYLYYDKNVSEKFGNIN
jgi:hypothetical protein